MTTDSATYKQADLLWIQLKIKNVFGATIVKCCSRRIGIEEEDIQLPIGSCGEPDTIAEGKIWVEEVIVHTGYAIGTQEYAKRYTIRTAKAKVELFLQTCFSVQIRTLAVSRATSHQVQAKLTPL